MAMAKRQGPRDKEDFTGEHTFGHNLLTTELVKKLSECATHWAVIMHFDHTMEEAPGHNFFPSQGLVNIFEQGKLCRATMLAGFKTSKQPQRPVPACFFRTLDFLLQLIASGNNYRAITDKEDAKGFPPAGWCRPPVVAAPEDAAAMTALATAGASPAELTRAPANHVIRLFYAARCWCHVYSFHVSASSVRVAIGTSPEELYNMFNQGLLSEYTMVVGLLDTSPPTNLWVPPCVMMPLGALLYMHDYGRPYLPVTLAELREIRSQGLFTTIGARREVRPLALPPGVLPPQEASIPGFDAAPPAEPRGSASGSAGAASSSSRQSGRGAASSSAGVGAAGAAAASGTSAGGSSTSRGGTTADAGSGSRPAGSSSSVAAPPPPPVPDPALDPILNSANWIMPQPFDAPCPSPVAPAPAADSGADSGNGSAADAAADAADGTVSPANAVAALPPSPFLGDFNYGVQPAFETPPLRLFLGERGQAALCANWWYVDSESSTIRGPYSPEQMMLSYVAGCRELHEETLVCGTDADIKPPMVPPAAAFLPLGNLLKDIDEGASYVLVSKIDMLSPLAQRLLGNRTRQPRPASATPPATTAAAAPAAAPVVVAALPASQPSPSPLPQQEQPQSQQQQQAQQPQPVVASVAASSAPAPVVVQVAPQAQHAVPPLPHMVPPVIRALPLPPHMGGPRPVRPMGMPVAATAGAPGVATPAFIMPGTMMYMQSYAPPQNVSYNGQPVVVQPLVHGMSQLHVVQPAQQQRQ